MMNDPHVETLIYRVDHGNSIDYSDAKPLQVDGFRFQLYVDGDGARFDLKEHCATEEKAKEVVADYIRVWEFDATLKRAQLDSFKLMFERAIVVDRNPTLGSVRLSASFELEATGSAKVTIKPRKYPAPPSDLALNPDLETMHHRFMCYREGREPLASMAYFCLTILEESAGGRRNAASKFQTEKGVLDKLGELSTNRGGQEARKAHGVGRTLLAREREFLEQAVKALIRRAAEVEHAPDLVHPKILLLDLPTLRVDSGCTE